MRKVNVAFAVLSFVFTIPPVYGADTASIKAKSGDGIYVGLDDGTNWLVSQSDAAKVRGWTVGDDVVEIDDSEHCTTAELINSDEHGERACVRDASSLAASITDKSDDGQYLALDDGSKWLVSDADQSTAAIWLVTDDVLYVQGSKTCPNIEIINVDEDGDEVCARPIR